MDQFRAKARQVAAAEETAAGLGRLEAKVDRILGHLGLSEAPEATPPPADEADATAVDQPEADTPAEEPEPARRNRRK